MEWIIDWVEGVIGEGWLVVAIVSMIPFVETRLGIPYGIRSGMQPIEAWIWGYLGSTLIIPVLLLVLIPTIKLLSKIRIFKNLSEHVINKFTDKAAKLQVPKQDCKLNEYKGKNNNEKIREESSVNKLRWREYLGIFVFAMLPLPLTGVWSSSALAAIMELKFGQSLAVIAVGNLVSTLLMTLMCVMLSSYIDTIIIAITLIATIAVIILLIKSLVRKRQC